MDKKAKAEAKRIRRTKRKQGVEENDSEKTPDVELEIMPDVELEIPDEPN